MQSVDETIAKAILAIFDDPVLVDGQLFYHTETEDGTKVRHPLERPRDITKEVMQHLCHRVPSELVRDVHKADVIDYLRTVARTEDAPPRPWDVAPEPRYSGLAFDELDAGRYSLPSNQRGTAFVRLVVSQILARRENPKARVPIIFVVGRRDMFPAVMTTLHNLSGGAVHVHAAGHWKPTKGALVSVYDRPPAVDDTLAALWLAVRGGTDPAPIPVVMCDFTEWEAWKRWMLNRSPKARRDPAMMPPMWAYLVAEDCRLSADVASKAWAGALAVVQRSGLSAYCPAHRPESTTPSYGASGGIKQVVARYLQSSQADDLPEPPPQGDDQLPPGSRPTTSRARGPSLLIRTGAPAAWARAMQAGGMRRWGGRRS